VIVNAVFVSNRTMRRQQFEAAESDILNIGTIVSDIPYLSIFPNAAV